MNAQLLMQELFIKAVFAQQIVSSHVFASLASSRQACDISLQQMQSQVCAIPNQADD